VVEKKRTGRERSVFMEGRENGNRRAVNPPVFPVLQLHSGTPPLEHTGGLLRLAREIAD
jgi:hypothetical protein